MKNILSRFLAIMLCFAMVCTLSACSDGEEKAISPKDNSKEISDKYDSIADDYYADKPIPSDASVLGEGFSLMDFTFTSADNTISFSLDSNSFAKILEGGTFYNSIAPGSEVISYEAGYKTARGLTLANTASEFIGKYGIADNNAVYYDGTANTYYNPRSGTFSGKLTALYGSADGMTYTIFSSDDVQKYISVRDVVSDNAYIDPAKIMALFPDYMTVAAINITADQGGKVSEFAIYRYDK